MLQRLCLLSAAKRQPGRRHLPLRTLGGSSSWPTVLSKPQRIRPPINHRHRCPLTEADPAVDGAIDDGPPWLRGQDDASTEAIGCSRYPLQTRFQLKFIFRASDCATSARNRESQSRAVSFRAEFPECS